MVDWTTFGLSVYSFQLALLFLGASLHEFEMVLFLGEDDGNSNHPIQVLLKVE